MWFKWALLVILVAECVGRILMIGTVREYDIDDAVVQFIFNLAIAIGILYYWR